MLSLCLSPTPRTYVATQYPTQDSVKRRTAADKLDEKKKITAHRPLLQLKLVQTTLEYSCHIPAIEVERPLLLRRDPLTYQIFTK